MRGEGGASKACASIVRANALEQTGRFQGPNGIADIYHWQNHSSSTIIEVDT